MTSHLRRREGFALAVALGAIVVIGGLIVGVLFAATQQYRIGRNTVLQARSLTAAEYGMNEILSTTQWNPTWNNAAMGTLVATRGYSPGDNSTDTVRLTSLGNGAFQLTSEGRAGNVLGAQGRKRIGALVTLSTIQINILGALTTKGATKIGGSSFIDGADDSVPNWSCPAPGDSMPGIAINDSTLIQPNGSCSDLSCVQGSPQVQQSAGAGSDSTYNQFGDLNWTQLTALATKTYPGGTLTSIQPSYLADGSCNTADALNWGDPYRLLGPAATCGTYYPIIYSSSSLSITGGAGQGILLVDGDLSVSGGFEFFGPVIVKGSLKTTGTGGHFTGGVLAENVDLEQNTVLGNAVITFSSCALSMALQASATPRLANGRSWADLY